MGIYDNMGDARNRTARPAGAPERTGSELPQALDRTAATEAHAVGYGGQSAYIGRHLHNPRSPRTTDE